MNNSRKDKIMELSERESELYELIKNSTELVTIEVIKSKLSEKHIGALGKLSSENMIEKKKQRSDQAESFGTLYAKKMVKYYAIKLKEEK